MRAMIGRYVKWFSVFFLSPGLVFGLYLGYLQESGNVHTIVADQAYRSRQLDHTELSHFLHTYKIKSIVNLRGPNKDSEWYQDELRLSEQFGIIHQDFDMSANREVSDEDLLVILSMIRDVPKPILIHCKSGADRTGLIAALYQYTMGQKTAKEASAQLSVWYGHFPFFGNSTAAMDRTFWRYVSTHPAR